LACIIFIVISSYSVAQKNLSPKMDSSSIQKQLNLLTKGNNHRRYKYLKNYLKKVQQNNISLKTQSIDWIGLYKNIIIEKAGRTDSIIYLVAHYDKIDASLLAFPNLLVNGGLDFLMSNIYLSEGAYDNGTGVVCLLSLLELLMSKDTKYTYRFLFAGMEEYGLRGSRRHMPKGASSDFKFFKGQSFFKDFSFSFQANLVGAFIPQRSYFTKRKKAIPVIDFSDDFKFSSSDFISTLSPLSFGSIHSYKDKITRVRIKNLETYCHFIWQLIGTIEDRGLTN
jgi:hypothetical protein